MILKILKGLCRSLITIEYSDYFDCFRIFDFRKIISCRETCKKLVSPDYPVTIDEVKSVLMYELCYLVTSVFDVFQEKIFKNYKIIEGHFRSPFVDHMPGIMPKETEIAKYIFTK